MSRDPRSLAIALFQAGIISQATLDKTLELDETKSDKGKRLYSAVLRSYNKYVNFIDILSDNTSLYGDVLTELQQEYNAV